jgi:dihydroflavonol-4-reductase
MTDETIAVPRQVSEAGPVLVTGAGGFLGTNLVWALRAHGLAVRALVRRLPVGPHWEGLHGVEIIQGDVRDPAALASAARGVGHVIHAAALTELVPRPRRRAFEVNVEGTRHLCAAALRAGVRRLVLVSSVATMARGSATAPATEATPYNLGAIRAPYYTSKRQAEWVVAEYAGRGLETVTLCPTFILGPRDARATTNQLLLSLSRRRWPVVVPGGMNVLDVREAALAHVRALWLGEPGARYLVAGPYCSYAELGRLVQQIIGTHRPVRVLPRWTFWPGSALFAIAAGILPRLPAGLSLPSFQYGYVPFHVSGGRGDRTFGLQHRPVSVTVYDTLRWFQQTNQAPWLNHLRLNEPAERPRGSTSAESRDLLFH